MERKALIRKNLDLIFCIVATDVYGIYRIIFEAVSMEEKIRVIAAMIVYTFALYQLMRKEKHPYSTDKATMLVIK